MLLIYALIIAVLAGVVIYNQLIGERQMVANGWSDIEVQLKRRADLIPRLVDTVKAYAAHERALFDEVTRRRRQALESDNIDTRGAAETALSRPVSRLIALAEDYPDLKANKNFLDLQNELSETEEKIEMARRFYNGAVREFNTHIQSVPANFIAGPFGFRAQSFFEIATSDSALPAVDF